MDDDARLRASGQDEVWFEQKRYGYGAGLPVHRKGWIVLGIYILGMILLGAFMRAVGQDRSLLVLLPAAGMIALTIWIFTISRRHTRGGWRWRWGDKD